MSRPGIVYASSTLALAVLELLVHTDVGTAPSDLVSVEIVVPGDLEIARLEASGLPRNWRDVPAPRRLQELGNEWSRRGETAILEGPSAIVPAEKNYLINPAREAAARIRVERIEHFSFDPRLVS